MEPATTAGATRMELPVIKYGNEASFYPAFYQCNTRSLLESVILAHRTNIPSWTLLAIDLPRRVGQLSRLGTYQLTILFPVGQLPQTSYQALQTPYSFFGLGRTNNYIENLFVGTTVHSQQHYINLEGVIPNSRVVIRPSADEGDTWRRELFLRPGDWIPWVTLVVIIGMFILAIITLILHMNEKVSRFTVVHSFLTICVRGRMNLNEGEHHITLILTRYDA
jgi:hypothetical protein